METKKAINETCIELMNEIGKYFELLEEHKILERVDVREQSIMRTIPLVFKNRLLKKLGK